jgi:UDP-2-acetamido-2,6-beta-L-arabino-hexul-4-ose reductase
MRVLVTGAEGFVGKNLVIRLREAHPADEIVPFTRRSPIEDLPALVRSVDFIFHFAGVNRPKDPQEFLSGNVDLTEKLCSAVATSSKPTPIAFTSSVQAEVDNPYGRSKLKAEQLLRHLHETTGSPLYLFRLPNVFGKWCRPNYNSVVATFCHNLARGWSVRIDDPSVALKLVYIDDVVTVLLGLLAGVAQTSDLFMQVEPHYRITVGELAAQIGAFRNCRTTLVSERVGVGLARALYATYVSYLPPNDFSYAIPKYGDARGVFVEMLKTPDAGQFSYFTAHPGVTRGGHYHHSKTEKFLVIKGRARFRFRHLITGEFHEILTSGEQPQVVETVPGWTHDVTNVGEEEMVVMLWANEIFDRERPDTIARALI